MKRENCAYVQVDRRNGDPLWVALRAACTKHDADKCDNCRQNT